MTPSTRRSHGQGGRVVTRNLYVLACGAGPAADVAQLATLAMADSWDVYVGATPAGWGFLDVGHPASPGRSVSGPRTQTVFVTPGLIRVEAGRGRAVVGERRSGSRARWRQHEVVVAHVAHVVGQGPAVPQVMRSNAPAAAVQPVAGDAPASLLHGSHPHRWLRWRSTVRTASRRATSARGGAPRAARRVAVRSHRRSSHVGRVRADPRASA